MSERSSGSDALADAEILVLAALAERIEADNRAVFGLRWREHASEEERAFLDMLEGWGVIDDGEEDDRDG